MPFWLGRKDRFTVVGPLSNGIQEFFRNGVAATISASVTNIPRTALEQLAMRFGALASLGLTIEEQKGPFIIKETGYWSSIVVRDGNDWKARMVSYSATL